MIANVRSSHVMELQRLRRRLELFLLAVHGRPFAIQPSDPLRPDHVGWVRRYVIRRAPPVRPSRAVPANDGTRLWLPRALGPVGAHDATLRYRALALLQAALTLRGAATFIPTEREAMARDLFMLYEGIRAEREVVQRWPRMTSVFDALRERAGRDVRGWGRASAEASVRRLLRIVLDTPSTTWPQVLPPDLDVRAAREWALEVSAPHASAWYRAQVRVPHWGSLITTEETPSSDVVIRNMMIKTSLPIGPRSSWSGAQQRDSAFKSQEGDNGEVDASNPRGGRALASEETASGDEAETQRSVMHSLDVWSSARRTSGARRRGGRSYHEWDYALHDFLADRVTVFEEAAPPGDAGWGVAMAVQHAALIRSVQREFRALGARRERHYRQLDGHELDLASCVDHAVALRAGRTPDERVYTVVSPPRGGVALAMLADVSASTNADVQPGTRVIDVEKLTLLVATYALEATGDPHALFTFSSAGADAVTVGVVKSFVEAGGITAGPRIARLEPGGTTRMGAAVRHVTASLLAQPAYRRLLLVISDAAPHDADGYMGDHAIEDSRMAVLEARAKGVKPHCIALEGTEPSHVDRIFGPPAYGIVRHPSQLPGAVLTALRRLVSQ